MDKKDILGKIASIFSEVLSREVSVNEFDSNFGLLESLHMDSLIALQIIVKIEQQFGVVIEDDDKALEMLNHIDQIVEYIAVGMERMRSL